MDVISTDLKVLREAFQQQQHRERLRDGTGEVRCAEVGHVEEQVSATPVAASTSATVATSETLRHLRSELGALTEQLHVEKLASAQLRIQQSCDAATIQELLDRAGQTDTQLAELKSQLKEWERRCFAAEEAHAGCATLYESVRTQLEGVQERVGETQAHQTSLFEATREAKELLGKLSEENARLQGMLRSREAVLLQLAGVELERDEARARVDVFEAQHAEWMASVRAYQRYFESAREEFVRSLQYMAAARREHVALKEALAQSETRCSEWESLFALLPGPAAAAGCEDAEVDSTTTAPTAAHTRQVCDSGDTASPHPIFVACLEAKVADLALRLCDAQARTNAAERAAESLEQLRLADTALLLSFKTAVCTLRPQAERLAAENAQLQARLLAAESFTTPLLEHVVLLGEAYVEEACRRCLLAARMRDGTIRNATEMTTASFAIDRPTSCSLLPATAEKRAVRQDGGERAQPPRRPSPSNVLRQSKRHRLRDSVLRQRSAEN